MTSVDTLRSAPADYAKKRLGSKEFPTPPEAKYLKGLKICLDPGHGGDAHKAGFKRGPTGVREAEINLRVGQYLRDLLVASGAEVKLTRESDVDSELAARANIANEWGADLFVSLHHNAIDKPETNYTTVWYHADVDHSPAGLDLARQLCDGLYDALALPQITAVPLKSDQLMYKTGFGVLRAATVPACLTETSFYTNPDEEQRLRDPKYNLREAYGLYRALARYAFGGLPRVKLLNPSDGVIRSNSPGGAMLEFELDDGLRGRKAWGHERQMILSDSVVVTLDGGRISHEFTNEGYRLRATLPPNLAPGEHRVRVMFANINKHSPLNPDWAIRVEAGGRLSLRG